LLLLLVFPVALSQSACSEDQLKAIASNIDRVAILIRDGREVRDELFTQGVIDNQDAFKVTLGLQKVNTALKVFNNKAKTHKAAGELTPEAKADLKKLAGDISSAAVELVSNGTFGVKNPDAQSKINAVIGSIHQVTLAVIDAVERLKPKGQSQPAQSVGVESFEPIPVHEFGFPPLALIPVLLLALRKIVGFVDRERERTGKTAEEIFAEAGAQLDANEVALISDLAKYAPEGEIPEDLEARVEALFTHLESQAQAQE